MDIIGFKRNKSHRGLLIMGIADMVILFMGFIFPFFYWGDGFDYQWFANLIAASILSIGFILFIIFYVSSFLLIKKNAKDNENEEISFPKIRFTTFPWVYLTFITLVFIAGWVFLLVNYLENQDIMKDFAFLLLITFFTLIPTWTYALRRNSKAILWNALLYLPPLIWSLCVFAFCIMGLAFLWILSGYPNPSLVIKFWDKTNSQSVYQYVLCSILFFYYLIVLNLYCIRSGRVQQYFKNP